MNKTNNNKVGEDDSPRIPLCVDLDGTLIRTDTLIESFFALLRKNFLYIFLVPIWLMGGKANFKEQIARRVDLNVALLPYHEEFLSFLREQQKEGRRLVLATAANKKYADAIASNLGIFEAVFSSDAKTNLSATRKLQRLQLDYGDRGFDYAGNSHDDMAILSKARHALLVNPGYRVSDAVGKVASVERIFERSPMSVLLFIRALRVHQWLKNLLLFAPLFAAHLFGDVSLLGRVGLAFLSFSLCASSAYILNDLVDLPDDRAHSSKRNRPFASGALPVIHGALLIPVLLLTAFLIGSLLPPVFILVLGTYYVVTLAYSIWLKRIVIVDVLVLAGLYTLRVLAGAAATSIHLSFWLLVFSMFMFMSLAMLKRYSELYGLSDEGGAVKGRGYNVSDLVLVNNAGITSGYLAALVLAMYIDSADIAIHYTHPEIIWLLCPLLLYWVSRMWLIAGRGGMHDDPLVFAVSDRISRWCAVLFAVTVWLAI